jgi:hypothetical protein
MTLARLRPGDDQPHLFPLKKLPVELPGEAQPEVGGSPHGTRFSGAEITGSRSRSGRGAAKLIDGAPPISRGMGISTMRP